MSRVASLSSFASFLLGIEPDRNIKLIADTLAMLYSDMSERHSKKLLSNVAELTRIKTVTFSAMRKALYAYSCVCDKVIKIVECQKCHNWFITNHILCPECSKKLMSKENYSQMLLYSCKIENCCGNPRIFAKKNLNEKKSACCPHRTRRVMGKYVLFVPPEAIIAELISCGLHEWMFGLEEQDIVEGVKMADALGYHHILYSENACAIYKEMKWKRAEEAVRHHLDHLKESNPISTLNAMVRESKTIEELKSSTIHY